MRRERRERRKTPQMAISFCISRREEEEEEEEEEICPYLVTIRRCYTHRTKTRWDSLWFQLDSNEKNELHRSSIVDRWSRCHQGLPTLFSFSFFSSSAPIGDDVMITSESACRCITDISVRERERRKVHSTLFVNYSVKRMTIGKKKNKY